MNNIRNRLSNTSSPILIIRVDTSSGLLLTKIFGAMNMNISRSGIVCQSKLHFRVSKYAVYK